MRITMILSILLTTVLFSSCSDPIIPVTEKDNVLAGSKLIEELSEETPASFAVTVKNLNYNNQLVSYVSGTIVTKEGNTILDGQFKFNSHIFNGYNNSLNNQNIYCYDASNYDAIDVLPTEFGRSCTFGLIKDMADMFKTELYIPLPIVLNNKSTTLSDNATITWNSDANNTLGVIILIHGQYYITEDDGNVNLSDIIGNVPDDVSYSDIGFYRGNGKVITGKDGRRYKLIALSETHLYTQIK